MLRRLLIASTIVAVAVPAFAQETMRVRGTIEKVDGSTLIVKSRDGADLKIAVVGDKPVYTALEKASLADIKPGTYIGVTSLPQADGSLKAVAVHLMEIDHGSFCRTVEIPATVIEKKITATYADGLLWVTLPKG